MKIRALTFALLAFTGPTILAQPDLIELIPGDQICLLGNALAERMQHHGWLETYIQSVFPEHELSFRPAGLLSTFQQQDILDLLAYLESLQRSAEEDE